MSNDRRLTERVAVRVQNVEISSDDVTSRSKLVFVRIQCALADVIYYRRAGHGDTDTPV